MNGIEKILDFIRFEQDELNKTLGKLKKTIKRETGL